MHSYHTDVKELDEKGLIGLNPCFNGRCTRTVVRGVNVVSLEYVLILVLMEDALVHSPDISSGNIFGKVLILVLMEDALVLPNKVWFYMYGGGLNPCFNGRCTRTCSQSPSKQGMTVLILVLMEDALVPVIRQTYSWVCCSRCLNPCFNGRCTRTCFGRLIEITEAVLILVLMEDALVLRTLAIIKK